MPDMNVDDTENGQPLTHARAQEQAHDLTHDDLANETGVSVTTIKSYRRKFPGFIPVLGFGKPIKFAPDALRVCLAIRDCFGQGLSVRETRKKLEEAGFAPDPGSVPPPSPQQDAAGFSTERMDEFLRAAGIMMQSVSKLAQAQKNTDQRLEKLERLMTELAATEAENRQVLARLGATEPAARRFGSEARPAARRVVKVRSSQGTVQSYTLGDAELSPDTPPETPPDTLLDVPVALQKESGEFLGLPGRLTLRSLAEKLPEQGAPPGGVLPSWHREGAAWRFEVTSLDSAMGGKVCGLYFEPRTSPAGVRLAVMTRLLLNGQEASAAQRMKYFRQIKDRHAAG